MAKKVKRKIFEKLLWASIWTGKSSKEHAILANTRKEARRDAAAFRPAGVESRVVRVRITEVR